MHHMPLRFIHSQAVIWILAAASDLLLAGPIPPAGHPPNRQFNEFAAGWDEEAWVAGGRREPYMRELDDQGWKLRMKAFQAVADSPHVPPSTAFLGVEENQDVAMRALAAQAFGYLHGDKTTTRRLMNFAENDKSPVVRLYAIDSLGKYGRADLADFYKRLREREQNRDVKRYLDYALDRGDKVIDQKVVQTLADWDVDKMDTARVGEIAPDFELESLHGGTVRLSDFRGKKSVVLVFIYGDT